MDEQTTEQPESQNVSEATVYEQLYSHLYAYRLGSISFLELLHAFEEILHIKTHSDQSDVA
jgi:hypothetical protein